MTHLTPSRLLVACSVLILGAVVLVSVLKNQDHSPGEGNEENRRPAKHYSQSRKSSDTDQSKRPAYRANTNADSTRPESHEVASQPDQASQPVKRVARRAPHLDRAIMEKRGALSHDHRPTRRDHAHANRLTTILGNSGLPARQRIASLESLTSPLSRDEQDSIYQAIENQTRPEGVIESAWHWMVDELITTLRDKGAGPDEVTTRLAAIHTDKSQPPVVRDYALQHLGHLRNEGGDIEVIEQTLVGAVNEQQGTIAGTALLALNQQGSSPEVAESALRVARDGNVSTRSRITALQVAGKQGNPEALVLAAETAADTAQPTALRIAAIATLGDLKAKDQLPLVQSLVTSPDSRLRNAAQAALNKLTVEHK